MLQSILGLNEALRPDACSATWAIHETVQHHIQVHRLSIVHELSDDCVHLVPREPHIRHIINDLQQSWQMQKSEAT